MHWEGKNAGADSALWMRLRAPPSMPQRKSDPLIESSMDVAKAGKGREVVEAEATPLATGVNIAVNVVGAGLLSLPWCLARAGVIPGLSIMALMCALNGLSIVVICACAERSGVFSFVEMGTLAVGPNFGRFIQAIAALYAAGSCVSYVVLIADFLPNALLSLGASDHALYASRAVVIGAITATVLLPLSLLRNLARLRFSSYAALLGILFSCGIVIWHGVSTGSLARMNFAKFDSGVFQAAPVLNVSFIMHYNAPRYYQELRGRSLPRMARIVAAVFGGVLVLYIAISVAGYAAFGAGTEGDVLNNFGDDTLSIAADLALATRIVLTLVIAFTFPLALHSLRLSVLAALPPHTAHRAFTPLTVFLVAGLALMGWSCKNVATVLSYKGAIAGTTLVYVYPALTYAALALRGVRAGARPTEASPLYAPVPEEGAFAAHAPPSGNRAACIRTAAGLAVAWAVTVMVLGVLKTVGAF